MGFLVKMELESDTPLEKLAELVGKDLFLAADKHNIMLIYDLVKKKDPDRGEIVMSISQNLEKVSETAEHYQQNRKAYDAIQTAITLIQEVNSLDD